MLNENLDLKIIDFGTARHLDNKPDENQLNTGTLAGTLQYVAPEMIQSR